MKQRYNVIPDYEGKGCITLNSEIIEDRSLKVAYVRFGIISKEVRVEYKNELNKNEITLTSDIIDELGLPIYLSYEIRINNNSIVLGPYIGMIAERKEETLDNTIKNLKSYVYSYEEIGGAILFFAADSIDMKTQTIRGYMYNPQKREWIKDEYQYPAAIFKRTGIKKELRNQLQSLLGNSIFNSIIFDKWEFYQWLCERDQLKEHLPQTKIYTNPNIVRQFLVSYSCAFIKPIYGSQGKGIIKVEKINEKIFRVFDDQNKETKTILEGEEELNNYLKMKLKPRGYIIQPDLELLSLENSKIDFRLILVKDGNGEWADLGLITRYGEKGNITSNISTGGCAEIAEETFSKILNKNEEETILLRKKISNIGKAIGTELGKCGINVGNLGIDFAIDCNEHIWIIEVNNMNPNHTIAIDAKDREMFYKARLLNMLYTKWLAGF